MTEAEPAPVESAPTKPSGDFVKTYVIVMGLLAGVLGYFCVRMSGQRSDFADANAEAMRIFGGPTLSATEEDKPTTIRSLAVGIHKFLQSYQNGAKPEGGESAIHITLIRARADAMGLNIRTITPETATPNRQRGYEGVSTTITFEATDLERLANFLYNLESSSTTLRILDVRWDLKPDKENPYAPGSSPGYFIGAPTVKIGLRRPITKDSRGN